ncbi:MAG: O-antigen ligase family protein [Clostridia bacterium]|nr:O-antigen ligase family protein [Clostridia bacterium]
MDKEKKRAPTSRSLILSSLTRFSAWIYTGVLSGFFSMILTSYQRVEKGFESSFLLTHLRRFLRSLRENTLLRAKHGVARLYEQSFFLTWIRRFLHSLLVIHCNNLGLIFFSYGFCVVIIQLLKLYTFNIEMEHPLKSLIVGIATMLIGILMFFSRKSLARLLYEGRTSRFILFDLLRISMYDIAKAAKEEPRRSFNLSLIFGMLLGALTIFIEPIRIPAFFVFLLVLLLVMNSPESAIVMVFMLLPFLTTMHLVFTMCLIYFSFTVKLICGRRVFRLQLVDYAAIAFMVFVFFGGVSSVDGSSFNKMLVFLCFMCGYFVVKNTLRSQALVRRCIFALITASVVESLIGLYQNFFAEAITTWQDTGVFSDIRGRVVSTLDNPNVLGEFIILVFPMILAMMGSVKRNNERFALLVAAAINCACLVFTWSRGAWLGFLVALIVFFLFSGRNALTAMILALPPLATGIYFAMDTAILHRFTNLSDSSSSYRFNIWRGVLRMLDDIGLDGIGIGEEAFRSVYPAYALSGIEAAPHSHNLFLQITVETGIMSLIAFIVFLFFYTQCSLGFCKNAYARSHRAICIGIFTGILAFLVQGMTDYVWYNYRVFLLFWLILGLGQAHIQTALDTEEESVPIT